MRKHGRDEEEFHRSVRRRNRAIEKRRFRAATQSEVDMMNFREYARYRLFWEEQDAHGKKRTLSHPRQWRHSEVAGKSPEFQEWEQFRARHGGDKGDYDDAVARLKRDDDDFRRRKRRLDNNRQWEALKPCGASRDRSRSRPSVPPRRRDESSAQPSSLSSLLDSGKVTISKDDLSRLVEMMRDQEAKEKDRDRRDRDRTREDRDRDRRSRK